MIRWFLRLFLPAPLSESDLLGGQASRWEGYRHSPQQGVKSEDRARFSCRYR